MKTMARLAGAAFATVLIVGLAYALTPTEILEKSYALENGVARTADYKMTVHTKRGKERFYEFTVYEKPTAAGAGKAIRVTEPADHRGLTVLALLHKNAPDQFLLYDAAKKKTKKLDASDAKDDFLDSDLSFFDLGVFEPAAYASQLLQQVLYDSTQCYLIESRPPKDFDAPYAYWRSWIDVTTFVTVKTEFYDKKNNLLKTITVKKSERVDGRWTATLIDVRAADNGDAKTTLALTKAKYNADVPDNYFTKEGLGSY